MLPLAQLKAAEARRRLQLLGTTVGDTRGSLLGVRARQVSIPAAVLGRWHECYLRGGLDALIPVEWVEIPETIWMLIERRYAALGELADAEIITVEGYPPACRANRLDHAPSVAMAPSLSSRWNGWAGSCQAHNTVACTT